MAVTDITLTNANVNGGTAVELNGVSFKYTIKNYVNVPDVPSKFAATDAQVVADFMGWTNPMLIIRGVLDTNNPVTNQVTIALLKAFAKEKTDAVYITEKDFFPTASTSKVQIKSIDFDKSKGNDANEGRVDFNMTLVETL